MFKPKHVRALRLDVTADNKCSRRESATNNSPLEGKGLVVGKELKTRKRFHKPLIEFRAIKKNVMDTNKIDKHIPDLENDSKSITSEENLNRTNLIKILLHKNQKQKNLKGIFDLIISPNNLSMA
jgi:hypothetical protein